MERLDGLPRLCRSETNELLLEMPFYQWPEAIWDTLYALCERRDIKIVLAHAERYPPEAIEQLIRDNVALQLNSECLTRPLHRKRYLTWIKTEASNIWEVISICLGMDIGRGKNA